MSVEEVLREKREKLGLTRKELGDALGLGKEGEKIIKSWEDGTVIPSAEKIEKINAFAANRPYAAPNQEEPSFRFIDLFAGIGGIRIPFQELGGKCVFTSEWDKFSQKTYNANFGEIPEGDITKIASDEIADFDVLLGGFPCQPFSPAGLHKGFAHTRGTLCFEIERIIKEKRPKAFLFENV